MLFSRISEWLDPAGKVFVHIFSHREFAYPFETEGPTNWMGKYFFTGGLMPSDDLLLYFLQELKLEKQWRMNGKHYALTAQAWLQKMYQHEHEILPILAEVYGKGNSRRWWVRWKLFFMACEELFGYNDGDEWGVSHYRFVKN
jgi:cyclopropane-fatty-acyl-phospholipid synthase